MRYSFCFPPGFELRKASGRRLTSATGPVDAIVDWQRRRQQLNVSKGIYLFLWWRICGV